MSKKNTSAQDDAAPIEAEVADHAKVFSRGDENLKYLYDGVPDGINVIEVAAGIFWARIPLPWSLNHINVYLIEEEDGWTLVDTGAQGKTGRSIWKQLEKTVLDGKPIRNIIATHMHPDHLGLAGWLAKRHGAKFYISAGEYFVASTLWLEAKRHIPEHQIEFMFKAGLSRAFEDKLRSAGFNHYRRGVHRLPGQFLRLEDGAVFTFGGRRWQIVMGRGHSPEHACLLCLDEPIFISGDQVLPDITSNVSVLAREPAGNPLAYWLSSLDRMYAIESDPLVLPSHGKVFKGLHNRLDSLIDSHKRKLKALHKHCRDEALSAVEVFPVMFRRQITGMDFFFALGESLAHMHLLESLGLAERVSVEGVDKFRTIGKLDLDKLVAELNDLPGVALRPLQIHASS